MKLTIEQVPKPCLMHNVHYQLKAAQWKRLCLKVFHYQASYRCGICGKRSDTLHCHEMWDYNDLARTRRLTGFLALCPLCYYGKNIEEAQILAKRGDLDLQPVIDHFCRVNQCTLKDFELHEREARHVWKRRNRQKKWKSDYGDYAYLFRDTAHPEKTSVLRRTRNKRPAFSKGAEKRKEARSEKKASSPQQQGKLPTRKERFKEQPVSWERQQETAFEAAFQQSVQR